MMDVRSVFFLYAFKQPNIKGIFRFCYDITPCDVTSDYLTGGIVAVSQHFARCIHC